MKLLRYTVALLITLLLTRNTSEAKVLYAGTGETLTGIRQGILACSPGDTLIIRQGTYAEGNIVIDKRITLIGENYPLLDGKDSTEVLTLKADGITVSGFRIENSGRAVLNDPCAIKVFECRNVTIAGNHLRNNYFGIYLQNGKNCLIRDNIIESFSGTEQESANGIHCWQSDSLRIIANTVSGHRDGIYFEFVTHSVIWRNISRQNLRYGLHFMFSNNDNYITNLFMNNGAGVAVMFSHHVNMINNTFRENWGDASYGLLLKEISDGLIHGNHFIKNTTGIFMEGTNRMVLEKNVFSENGWAMKIQASCLNNVIHLCNFLSNTFDTATNGSNVENTFEENYWDRYEGYDLDKNGLGDVPYRPLSMYSVIVENNESAMLLYRSFMVTLLDKSEKIFPTVTPDHFMDPAPRMKPMPL